ncbi:hypothetical protein [Stenotrophomonas sp. 278]|uniref:hypothetical protein n=1 Tax=Stenotrophomonas sp. 278 TaxID=2479851 RepID=UPI000F66275B|nr:hypothetical protein [Stenotrophomonas sp. 278]RRU12748.1 hypothetical protein EGJ34_12080 [Stenotrophomonas sp. 278]
MTGVHVLGGVSLVIVVAASSAVRTGLSAHVDERQATAAVAAGDDEVGARIQMPARDEGVVPAAFGPLRDRMRP